MLGGPVEEVLALGRRDEVHALHPQRLAGAQHGLQARRRGVCDQLISFRNTRARHLKREKKKALCAYAQVERLYQNARHKKGALKKHPETQSNSLQVPHSSPIDQTAGSEASQCGPQCGVTDQYGGFCKYHWQETGTRKNWRPRGAGGWADRIVVAVL